MIPKMKKFLFAGAEDDMEEFFSRAQILGEMEFLSLQAKKPLPLPENVKEMTEALKILRKQPVLPQEYASPKEAKVKVKNILFHNKEIENFHERIRILKADIARIQPLGDFSLKSIEAVKQTSGKYVQFFVARHSKIQEQTLPESLVFINSEFDQDYFLHIGDTPLVHPLLSELVVTISLADLKIELERVNTMSETWEKELKELSVYTESIREALAEELSRVHLHQAKGLADFQVEGFLFFVEAWIPENKIASILLLTEGLAIICEEVAIEAADVIPTYMENKGFAAVGEDLVHVYDVPSTRDKDPSGWVIWAFALFFSMIIADAGYGALYLLAAIVLWMKFPRWTGYKRRFQKLLTVLASFSIVWGILIGSYFSVQYDPGSKLNRLSILYYLANKKVEFHIAHQDEMYHEWLTLYPQLQEAKTPLEFFQKAVVHKKIGFEYKLLSQVYDAILMEIALIVGIFHLSLSMLRNLRRSWSGAGWLMFLIGGYLYFPSMLDAHSLTQYLGVLTPEIARISGLQLLSIGAGVAVIAALIQEKWAGAGEILKAIQIFADVLSYLRLYALGLASMVMAITFNELGEYVGLTFGIIVIILGHMVNITIGIMGGVIHGLRLNFLEWYHYSFEGGGKAFNPLRIIKIGE